MLGDFISSNLIIVLGYAYPAFECFKTVEKDEADIEQLRFWCQYWIIVAVVTAFERIGEIFVSWLPMYGEAKLAFFIYLWYPKTKGTIYVYETFLRPYVAMYEMEIDRKLQELRARAWDFVIQYSKTFASLGQTKFYEVLQYLASQSAKARNFQVPQTQQQKSPPSAAKTTTYRATEQQMHVSMHHQPPPRPPPMSINRAVFQAPKTD